MGNVLPRFHGYLFLQKQTRLLKSWFVHSAGETDMCKISFFYVGLLTFYSAKFIFQKKKKTIDVVDYIKKM